VLARAHDTYFYVMDRLRRVVAGDDTNQEDYPCVPMLLAAISGAMMHPFTATFDDDIVRTALLRLARRSLGLSGWAPPDRTCASRSDGCGAGDTESASCRGIRRGHLPQLPDRAETPNVQRSPGAIGELSPTCHDVALMAGQRLVPAIEPIRSRPTGSKSAHPPLRSHCPHEVREGHT
jgi:hypothetical protein